MSSNKEDAALFEKALRFFHKYERELEQIRALLDIRLNQLALAYTIENKLPCESVSVKTRIKTIESFLKKIHKMKMNDFHFPTNIVYDLIGARVTCWFLDDCQGITDYILNCDFVSIEKDAIFDYINAPKESGYRSIHLHANISYDRITSDGPKIKIVPQKIKCEIQIRTKLMDTWADLTHEFHYKAKEMGIEDKHMEKLLGSQAERFFSEDHSFVAIRNIYQKIIAHSESNSSD